MVNLQTHIYWQGAHIVSVKAVVHPPLLGAVEFALGGSRLFSDLYSWLDTLIYTWQDTAVSKRTHT